MTKQEFIEAAKAQGYVEDRWGHLQKTYSNGTRYRLKLQEISVRLESWTLVGGKHEWVRLYMAYYSRVTVNNVGKFRGFVR